MVQTKDDVEFVGRVESFVPGGGPRARMGYKFRLQSNKEREIVVWANFGAVMTLEGGQLSPEEVERAAKTLVQMEIENGVALNRIDELELDHGAMFHIAMRLGWSKRFHKSI